MADKILEVKNLVTQFKVDKDTIQAVRGVSFDIYKGKTLGIVGESGSGKSTVALSIMRLISPDIGKIYGDKILLQDQDILKLSEGEMRKIRGNKISMIFQEPMTSLNPVFTIGNQIQEVLLLHQDISPKEAKNKCIELLDLVSIPAPKKRIREYPHQLSGGMRQRVMIAMTLACQPSVLIADEPTTALDVTIQAQILDLMRKLQAEMGMGIVLITHDLGVVAEMCDKVAVMYCGKIVEYADVNTLFSNPSHPYTKGLIASVPFFKSLQNNNKKRLSTIAGVVPSLSQLPLGCSFQARCHLVDVDCKGNNGDPLLREISPKHSVACFHPYNNNLKLP